MKQKKYKYQLIGPGIKTHIVIMGQLFPCKLRALYYSDPKIVYAPNEELARAEVRRMLKDKYSAFVLEEVKERKEEHDDGQGSTDHQEA